MFLKESEARVQFSNRSIVLASKVESLSKMKVLHFIHQGLIPMICSADGTDVQVVIE